MSKSKPNPLIWLAFLLWKGAVLSVKKVLKSVRQLRFWLLSKDGVVFLCAFTIVLIFGSFWILDNLSSSFGPAVADIQEGDDARVRPEPNPILARIGTETLTLNNVLEFARQDGRLQPGERLSAMEAMERGLVEDAIDQTLLARAATTDGLMSDPDVRARLIAARNRILAAAYLESQVEKNVTPDAARELYQSQRRAMSREEEIRLRELVVADAATAMDLSAAINSGVPFLELIRNNSIAPSAANNGDLGYVATGSLPHAYAEKVSSLSSGLYTLPIETAEGWAILKVEGRQRITPPPYDKLEAELIEFLRLKTIDSTLEGLRERARVEIFTPGAQLQPGIRADTTDEEPATLRD